MFRITPCEVEGCSAPAFSSETRCYAHLAEQPERLSRALKELQSSTTVLNRVFDGGTFQGIDFSRIRFVGCSFRGGQFRNSMFTGASFHLCFLDSSQFISCDLSGADIDFCSFGQTRFLDCSFENSELIQTSFNGAIFTDCTFSGSNLYNSRFMLCELNTVNFDNCDFKRAFYIPSKETGVTFTSSNIAEAVRDLEHLYL